MTTQTIGSVAKDLLHFAGRAASDNTHNKFTRKKLTKIFTPSTAGSSANLGPVSVIHLDVAPLPGGLDLMSDFNEDASHAVGKEDKQQLTQTMDSLCSTQSTTSSAKFPGTGCVFRKESDNANTLRGRTSTSYARSSSAQVHDEEERAARMTST